MLTQASLQSEVGASGPLFIAVAIFLFAFSSIIGNYYYGEANIRFLTDNRSVMVLYRLFSGGVMVMFGALATLNLVWSLGDLCMALLTACNLVAIIALGKYVFRLLDDYRHQKRQGIKTLSSIARNFLISQTTWIVGSKATLARISKIKMDFILFISCLIVPLQPES